MNTNRLSASKIAHARKCGYPFRPDVVIPERQPDEGAAHGTAVHAQIEHTIRTGDETPQSDEHASWLDDWWQEHKGIDWQVETITGLDPTDGTSTMYDSEHRDYRGINTAQVPGTIDAWAQYMDGEALVLHIADWKSGFGGYLGSAKRSDQLLHNVAAVLPQMPVQPDIIRVEYVRICKDRVFSDRAELKRSDIMVFLDDLSDLVFEIERGPDPVAGTWCITTFCPLRGLCPATRNVFERMDLGLTAPHYDGLRLALDKSEFRDEVHKRWQILALKSAEKTIEAAWDAVKAAADEAQIDMGDDVYVYRKRTKTSQTLDLDNEDTLAALRNMLGDGVDSAVKVVTKLPNEELDKVISVVAKAEGKKIKHMKEAVWTSLRERGLAKTKDYADYRMVKLGVGEEA